MKRLVYILKVEAGWDWVALGLIHAAMLLALFTDAYRAHGAPRQSRDAYALLQLYLPLALALLLAAIPAQEALQGVAELHLTYRQPAGLRLAELLLASALLWGAVVAATGLAVHLWYAPMTLREFGGLVLPPALAMGAAACAGTAVARHSVGGSLPVLVWWGLDLIGPGQFNRWVYLFSQYQPVKNLDAGVMQTRMLTVAVLGLALTLWLAGRRERWVRG